MNIVFSSTKLKELCEQERVATRKLGKSCFRKLKARLTDILAAANVSELVAGRPHPLERDRLGQFAVDLSGGKRLVFECANDPEPLNDAGGIDWARVTVVRIVFIGDYHD